MEVSVGRTVHYILSENDCAQINRRRTDSKSIAERIAADKWPLGAQAHVGNHAAPGDVVPLVVVRVWPNEFGDKPGINGQALLDGNDALWVTSAKECDPATGLVPGQWFWPPRN